LPKRHPQDRLCTRSSVETLELLAKRDLLSSGEVCADYEHLGASVCESLREGLLPCAFKLEARKDFVSVGCEPNAACLLQRTHRQDMSVTRAAGYATLRRRLEGLSKLVRTLRSTAENSAKK
jgi:hypothetical protein